MNLSFVVKEYDVDISCPEYKQEKDQLYKHEKIM